MPSSKKKNTQVYPPAAGEELWREAFAEQHEGTDVAVAADGSGFAISGHGGPPGVQGRVTVVAADGASSTTATVTLGGDPDLIFTECRGIAAAPAGGFVLACGAGIEECRSGLSASQLRDCRAGRGDGEGAEGVFQRTGEGGLEAEVAHVLSKVPTGTDSAGSAQGSAAAVRRRDAIGDDGECPVCFSEFGSGEAQVRRAVTPCRHAFCVKCVASVLRMAPPANVGTCPLCRADVRLEELFVE